MQRPLTTPERTEAQQRIDVDGALLRDVRNGAARLRARANVVRGEIAGARQAIAEKERQIHDAEAALAELEDRLARLAEHEAKLATDQAAWTDRLAG